jgi:uncharacterized repeat protein (TIGR03806 family)
MPPLTPRWSVLILLLACAATAVHGVDVITQHFDNGRSGANTQETLLTTGNVNQASFGKLFSVSLNANVNGQALYVPGLTINGGSHNVLFCYTSNNRTGSACGIYAFDADVGGAALWSRTLTNAAQYTTNTPVIDTASNTMYFVSKDNDDSGSNWLHAVSILTGAEKTGSPVQIGGSVAGTGGGHSGSTVTFPASHANCRPGLLLVKGVIYCGFAFNTDVQPYHGWIFAYSYNGTAFTPAGIFCDTPNSEAGGIWQAGKGLASDGTNIFCTTGNGNFDNSLTAGSAFSMCVLRLNPTLGVLDYFAPANESNWSGSDQDLGNCGLVIIPGTALGFTGSTKYGMGHLVNINTLGHFNGATDTCLQTVSTQGGVGSNPVAWNGGGSGTFVYLYGGNVQQWQLNGTSFSNGGSPVHTSSAGGGGSLCVSSNGTANGILWAVTNAVVHAYDATNVTTELWNSDQNSGRDSLPSVGHFQFPMVANGKVYVPTDSSSLVCYGRLATQLAFQQQPSGAAAGATINPAITVAVEGATGIVDTTSNATITLSIASNPGGGTLGGTLSAAVVNGVATFSGLSISQAGAGYTLTATSNGLSSATSAAFTINTSATSATKLAFVQQPTTTQAGTVIAPALTVAVEDSTGTTVAGATNAVTISITTNPSSGTLGGTLTVNAVNGIATFSTLTISRAGTGYVLGAASSGLTASNSAAFTVTAAPAATPVITPNGGTFSGPVSVTFADANAGTTIYYTTNGVAPTTASTAYNSAAPPVVSSSATVMAIAAGNGFSASAAASAAFTISGSTPYGLPTRPVVSGLNVPPSNINPPLLLSQTGVFSNLGNLTPAPGIIPYVPNVQLWSDNASKLRWIALPGNGKITFQPTGEWSFPGGTILIKHFEMGIDDTDPTKVTRLETRLLVLNSSGTGGYGITYQWNTAQTDANLLDSSIYLTGGLDQVIPIKTIGGGARTQTWHYPSQNECLTCHTSFSGFVLGPKTRQLNGTFAYPASGVTDNQLRTWNYLEMFTTNIGEGSIGGLTHMQPPSANADTLVDRVKSYLDANCANCHRPGGVNATWDARYDTAMASQNIINGAVKNTFGLAHAAVVVPQNISSSVMFYRMNVLGSSPPNPVQMPPVDRQEIDAAAINLLAQWIDSLAPTGPVITSVVPGSGIAGTAVTINGSNFSGATALSFNGTAGSITVVSATKITTTVPAGATTGTITVTGPNGTGSSPGVFIVGGPPPAPTITALSPTTGSSGSTIIITGTSLAGTSLVTFNGASATFSVVSDGEVEATVPTGATTGTVSLTTPGGVATSTGSFTVVAVGTVPLITAISPGSGPIGTSLIITGTGLGNATAVSIGGTPTTFTVNLAGTQITAVIPAGSGSGPVSVTTPTGTANSATAFTAAAPVASSGSSSGNRCGNGIYSIVGLLLLSVVLRRLRLRPGAP